MSCYDIVTDLLGECEVANDKSRELDCEIPGRAVPLTLGEVHPSYIFVQRCF